MIGAWDPSVLPEVSPEGNCLLTQNVTIDSLHRNQFRWVPFFDVAGNIIAEIYADGKSPGVITGSFFVNASGGVRMHNDRYYLDRNLTLKPEKNVPVQVRIYFTQNELAALQQADPSINSPAQLMVIKTDSACSNIFKGDATDIYTDKTGTYGEDHYLQFTAPSLSTFYVGGQRSSTGLNTFDKKLFRVYPNPFQGEFFIEGNSSLSDIKWILMDSNGRVVKASGRISLGEKGVKVNAKLPTGMYFLKIQDCLTNKEFMQKVFSW